MNEGEDDYIPSQGWKGAKKGWVFKTDDRGTGYYRDYVGLQKQMMEDKIQKRQNDARRKALMAQEVQNSQNVALQEKFHRRISKGARNISDILENNGMKFILERAK